VIIQGETTEQYFSGRKVRKAPLFVPSGTSPTTLLSLAGAFDFFLTPFL